MENNDLKIISEKMSLIIKILLAKDESFKKLKASEKISMIDHKSFSAEQISSLLDIPIKTVRNVLPQLKINERQKR